MKMLKPLTRREWMLGSAALFASALMPRALWAELAEGTARALASSQLVYISPLLVDGSESACHGEVWFVTDGEDVLVVTSAERWRAEAVRRGLNRARLWVGEHGIWTRSDEAFKASPSYDATARLEEYGHAAALGAFGRKYPDEWGSWGPRFRKGLADGSRVLIRYTP